MFSNAEADALLVLDKRADGNTVLIRLSDFKTRFHLYCDTHPEYEFLVQIELNQKINFKISLHHQEDNTKIGLLRVDFRGSHKNPDDASRAPIRCKPFAGKFFEPNEPHIHLYSDAYKPLAWAIPLKDYGFPVLNVSSDSETEDAIRGFMKIINVVSTISVEQKII